MIEKNKKYDYEELKKIIILASGKVTKELDEMYSQANDETGMGKLMFNMQNMMTLSKFIGVLLGEDEWK